MRPNKHTPYKRRLKLFFQIKTKMRRKGIKNFGVILIVMNHFTFYYVHGRIVVLLIVHPLSYGLDQFFKDLATYVFEILISFHF